VTPALRARGLSKRFGEFVANRDIDFVLSQGARHALIGPNGAGKTTFINLLTGATTPTSGDVFIGDERVTHLPQHARVKRGLSRTFQINTLFPGLTVLESVVLAIAEREALTGVWYRTVARERAAVAEAREHLARLMLLPEATTVTRHLAYGKQRLLEIALALATGPDVLLLDEPAAGVPAEASAELFNVLERMPREVSILLIEHDMDIVFGFADRISVLVDGKIFVEGAPDEIANDPRVRAVYLGERADG
jgi:branched-chain amino acid transport system ATP-binding protein